MKKNYILGITAIASLSFFAMQKSGDFTIEKYMASKTHKLNGAGAQDGYTGAPGEGSCATCHVGSAQDGSAVNSLILMDGVNQVSGYVPGNTYTVVANVSEVNAGKGFGATALDATNNKAGSFSDAGVSGTSVSNATRDYATHTSNSNANIWSWTWAAPSTDVGPVTFYLATNVTNGIGTAGDAIYLSQHVFGNSAGLEVVAATDYGFSAGYASNGNKVLIEFNSLKVDNMFFNLVDMNGRSVFTYDLGESSVGENSESIVLPSDIETGVYMVNFFVGNNPMSSKIMIQK